MTKFKWAAWLVLLGILITSAVLADSWIPPETRAYVSSDGAWRLTVQPRGISSPLAYFEDKVANRPLAGSVKGSTQTSALAHMEHQKSGRWVTVWNEALVNEVSPVDALALNGGRAVTFDNWHSMGYGKNAIAIYDVNGKLVRAVGLSDFLPTEYIHALPHSVSSIEWRGKPRISEDGRHLVVPVVIPSVDQKGFPDEEHTAYIDIRFDLATGQRVPDTSPAWTTALASARKADQKLKKEEAAAKSRFILPLPAPTSSAELDWHSYLVEAFFRLDKDWDEGYPATEVIRLPDAKDFDQSVGFLREALSDNSNSDSVIMIASPSQDVLVDVLKKEFARVNRNALIKARVYVAVDQGHIQAVRKAVAPTGAELIQIDTNKAIPQRKERLNRYLEGDREGLDSGVEDNK